jgi:hypothetical protein
MNPSMCQAHLNERGQPFKGENVMTIRVLYTDKKRGLVEDSKLDDLASNGLIKAFSLPGSDKWVHVTNKNLKKKN